MEKKGDGVSLNRMPIDIAVGGFRNKLAKMLVRSLPRSVVGWLAYRFGSGFVSFSGYGEDIQIMRLLPFKKGFYVDIGAFHPKRASNTYALWKRGWHGINVDADEYKIAMFQRFRPNDTNVATAVSSQSGVMEFYSHDGHSYGSMSSLDRRCAEESAEQNNRSLSVRQVSVVSLNELLEQYLPRTHDGRLQEIDVINIDVEEHELEILTPFNFALYRPKCFVVEIHSDTIKDVLESPVYQLLVDNGYELVSWPAESCIFWDFIGSREGMLGIER
jgi:FkbM family methyltransferase